MKFRTILPLVSSLSVFAVPVLAQDAAEKKVEQAPEPTPPEATKDAEGAGAPAPETTVKTEATATVNMGSGDAKPEPKRVSLAAPVTTKGGAESDASAKEWKTDFHGHIRVPFRVGMGVRPSPRARRGRAPSSSASPRTRETCPPDSARTWASSTPGAPRPSRP